MQLSVKRDSTNDGARMSNILFSGNGRYLSNQFTMTQNFSNQVDSNQASPEIQIAQLSNHNQTFFDRRRLGQREYNGSSLSRKITVSKMSGALNTPKNQSALGSFSKPNQVQGNQGYEMSVVSTQASTNLLLPEINSYSQIKHNTQEPRTSKNNENKEFQKLLNLEKYVSNIQSQSTTPHNVNGNIQQNDKAQIKSIKKQITKLSTQMFSTGNDFNILSSAVQNNLKQQTQQIQIQNESKSAQQSSTNANNEQKDRNLKIYKPRKSLLPLQSNHQEIIAPQNFKKLSANTMALTNFKAKQEQKTLEQVGMEALDPSAAEYLDSINQQSKNQISKNKNTDQKVINKGDSEAQSYSRLRKSNIQNISQSADRTTSEMLPDFLQGHDIRQEYRARMVDWMIQVFRVLKCQNPQTFFLSISLMDRYFGAKQKLEQFQDKSDLHIIGLVSVLLSSKYEDVFPIRMVQILQDAGHQKYAQQEVLERERDFLSALKFKLQDKNLYEESAILFKSIIFQFKKSVLNDKDLEVLYSFHQFICQLILHDYELVRVPLSVIAPVIISICIKYVIKLLIRKQAMYKIQGQNNSPQNKRISQGRNAINEVLEKSTRIENSIKDFKSLLKYLKIQHIYHKENEQQIKLTKKRIVEVYLDFQSQGFKNLEKNFPHFLDTESFSLFSEFTKKEVSNESNFSQQITSPYTNKSLKIRVQ